MHQSAINGLGLFINDNFFYGRAFVDPGVLEMAFDNRVKGLETFGQALCPLIKEEEPSFFSLSHEEQFTKLFFRRNEEVKSFFSRLLCTLYEFKEREVLWKNLPIIFNYKVNWLEDNKINEIALGFFYSHRMEKFFVPNEERIEVSWSVKDESLQVELCRKLNAAHHFNEIVTIFCDEVSWNFKQNAYLLCGLFDLKEFPKKTRSSIQDRLDPIAQRVLKSKLEPHTHALKNYINSDAGNKALEIIFRDLVLSFCVEKNLEKIYFFDTSSRSLSDFRLIARKVFSFVDKSF